MFLYSRTVWDRYLHDLPKSPDAVAQRTYPLNVHGIVVFQTKQERNSLWIFDRGGIAIFFIGLALCGATDLRPFSPSSAFLNRH